MKTASLFLLLFVSSLFFMMSSCSDDENSYAQKMTDYTILVVDNETQNPRSREPVSILSYGNDGKIAYKRTYITNDSGELGLKLEQGKYRAEFAFVPGKELDNFLDFEISANSPGTLTMPIFDKRDYYDCTLQIMDTETLEPRVNESVIFITLNDNDAEVTSKTLTTDSNGKISFHVVAGKYRAKFGYETPEEIDNTLDFEITAEGDKNLIMNVKPSSLDDRKPVGYVYFEDDFDWVTSDFGGSDYMDGSFSTTEKYIANTNDPLLLAKVSNAGWVFEGVVSFRLGYIKFGSASTVNSSKGTITTSTLPIDEDKFSNIKIKIKVARYITKAGAKDAENLATISIIGDGSFSRTSSVTSTALSVTNEAYNEWVELEAVAYNVSANTKISIGKAKQVSVGRFFCDGVSIIKDSKAEIQ